MLAVRRADGPVGHVPSQVHKLRLTPLFVFCVFWFCSLRLGSHVVPFGVPSASFAPSLESKPILPRPRAAWQNDVFRHFSDFGWLWGSIEVPFNML